MIDTELWVESLEEQSSVLASGAGSGLVSFEYPEETWVEDTDDLRLAFSRLEQISGDQEKSCATVPVDQNGRHTEMRRLSQIPDRDRAIQEAAEIATQAKAIHSAEERGWQDGFEKGRSAALDEAGERFAEERNRWQTQIAAMAESFDRESKEYLHCIEKETVRLALAIVARILRRQVEIDPLSLTGAVRVALGQLAQSTVVRLHVPDQDEAMWREALARMPGLTLRPTVVGEAEMEPGECRMETELGSANLGFQSQLNEIERGFFDHADGR